MIENQQSRYGAISKVYPFTTGKAFFLVNASEQAQPLFGLQFPNDKDGVPRVYTTWAAVITACQANTDADVVIVSPLFTTPPTKAQQQALDAAGVVTIQAGSNLPDGSYIAATLTAPSLAATTTNSWFSITGRVELLDIEGEISTTVGATGTNGKFTVVPTVGSTTDMCATGTTTSLPVGAQLYITGTLATALQTTTQAVYLRQASPLILQAGTLQFITNATTTGNVKTRLRYKPIDPGAFIAPLI